MGMFIGQHNLFSPLLRTAVGPQVEIPKRWPPQTSIEITSDFLMLLLTVLNSCLANLLGRCKNLKVDCASQVVVKNRVRFLPEAVFQSFPIALQPLMG